MIKKCGLYIILLFLIMNIFQPISEGNTVKKISVYIEGEIQSIEGVVQDTEVLLPLEVLDLLDVRYTWESDGVNVSKCDMHFEDKIVVESNEEIIDSQGVYFGDISEGMRNGEGKQSYLNGDVYIGQFINNYKSGFGIYYYEDGGTYEGEYKYNIRDGIGKRIYPDRSYYNGEWEMGLWNGYGLFSDAGGKKTYGEWNNNYMIKRISKEEYKERVD